MKPLMVLLASILFTYTASAQSPCLPDISRKTSSDETYSFHVDTDGEVDLLQVCAQRVDVVPVIDLGCIDVTSPPADPLVGYPMTVTVATTAGDDAELRLYSEALDGDVSVLSCNKADLDFTAPRSPRLKN